MLDAMETQARPKRRRLKLARPVFVRPSSPADKHFQEVRTTLSASTAGLYFTSWREGYYKGMRLFVTYPYSAQGPVGCSEYVGEVTAVDHLEGMRRGIGVRFLSSVSSLS